MSSARLGKRERDTKHHKPLAIDLFCGCGGLTLGLKRAGFDVLAGIEVEPKAQATYRMNHPEVKLYGDIRRVTGADLRRELSIRRGRLDLLAGCPPCQSFSRLRRRNRKNCVRDTRNDLVAEFQRLVRSLFPKVVLLENVPSLFEHHRFKTLQRNLRRLGYKGIARVLDAADYGVPQRRKRLILVASRVGVPAIHTSRTRAVTVRDAISRLPRAGTSGDPLHDLGESRAPKVKRLIAAIPKNGGSRTVLPRTLQLRCHRKSDGFRDIYGRMAWDSVAPTITSGCHNPSKGRFLHPTRNRTITLREAAILQGFPRTYRFISAHGKEAIALMIGNALPPKFVSAHGTQILKHLRLAKRQIS